MEPASASRSARLLLGLKQLPAACSSSQLRHIQTRRIRGSGIPRESAASLWLVAERHTAVPDSHGPGPSDEQGFLFLLSLTG